MKIRPIHLILGLGTVLALGCASTETSGGSSEPLILDGRAQCDPTASALDDVFIFEVDTVDSVDLVEVDVYVGSSATGTVRLTERSSGNWYGEEMADDLDSDCDEFSSMLFEIIAEKGDEQDSADINPD